MQNFEKKIENIKSIIEKLGSDDIKLNEGVKLYKEAEKQIKQARELLEKAKLEITTASN